MDVTLAYLLPSRTVADSPTSAICTSVTAHLDTILLHSTHRILFCLKKMIYEVVSPLYSSFVKVSSKIRKLGGKHFGPGADIPSQKGSDGKYQGE